MPFNVDQYLCRPSVSFGKYSEYHQLIIFKQPMHSLGLQLTKILLCILHTKENFNVLKFDKPYNTLARDKSSFQFLNCNH